MNPFARVLPDEEQTAKMAGLNRQCASLYENIKACAPDSIYKTEALNQLVIVGMLANKAITHGTK